MTPSKKKKKKKKNKPRDKNHCTRGKTDYFKTLIKFSLIKSCH